MNTTSTIHTRRESPTWVEVCVLLAATELGPRIERELASDPALAWALARRDPAAIARLGLSRAARERLVQRHASRFAETELTRARQHGLDVLALNGSHYPRELTDLVCPPLVLYGRGDLGNLARPTIAIVGSRGATSYGLRAARRFGRFAGRCGIAVVSGLARGIDRAAHEGVLEEGGIAIGVLGCGHDVVYPPESRELQNEVARSGLLLSEFALGTRPAKHHFPRRNRIIGALPLAVVIVEAAAKSGSLSTAAHALELGRDLFVIPGPIDSPQSEGTNALLRDGAHPLLDEEDLLLALGLGFSSQASRVENGERLVDVSDFARRVLRAMNLEDIDADALCERLECKIDAVCLALVELESKKHVRSLPGGRWARA